MAKDTPTRTLSVEDYLRKQAELDQEKEAVIAQLEAEIQERQDLLAKLRGGAPKPAGKKRHRRTKEEIAAARAAGKA